MSAFSLDGCTALVTGASAGIGREIARQLAARAGSLILVARRQDRLDALRAELTAADPNLNVIVHAADLSQTAAVEWLIAMLERESIAIDLLVNNAGLGDLGEFATSDAQRVADMLSVNICALTTLTHRLLQPMISRKRGAIMNISSSASFLPIAGMAVYAATKAYVTSFSEALRAELRGTGVRVTAVCPGPVHTEFNEVAKRRPTPGKFAPEFTHVSASAVARAALRAIERDKPVVIPGFVMKLGMAIIRMTPMPILRITARATERS